MQAGGSLNALATKLFRSRMIVLFSDLLDACGDDEKARDMVIGHEIGHLKSRHLDFHWLLLPGFFVPFLGAAYSRAREFTCDRWGRALCDDAPAASRGLAVLAAGGRLGPKVDLAAYIEQRRDLDTGWLTLGRWLAPYPPLSRRIEVLRPDVPTQPFVSNRGTLRAVAILVGVALIPMVGMGFGMYKLMSAMKQIGALQSSLATDAALAEAAPASLLPEAEHDGARARAAADFARIEAVLRAGYAKSGAVPEYDDELHALWASEVADEPFPTDPFTGNPYEYYVDEPTIVVVYSAGPDAETATEDDIDHTVELGG
jgi:hypothetical protein